MLYINEWLAHVHTKSQPRSHYLAAVDNNGSTSITRSGQFIFYRQCDARDCVNNSSDHAKQKKLVSKQRHRDHENILRMYTLAIGLCVVVVAYDICNRYRMNCTTVNIAISYRKRLKMLTLVRY